VIIQALAIDAAKNVKPSAYNRFITAVTEPGPGKVKVYSYAQGVQELSKGKQIQYIGVSGELAFNKWHNIYGNQVAVQFPTASLVSQVIKGVIPASQLSAAG